MLTSIVAAPIYIPTKCVSGLSPTSLPAFVVLCFPDDSYSDWGEMICQGSFDLNFPNG
jgi:hypothetical protein